MLLEIIETYNNMMVPASRKKPAFDPIICALLDPIIQQKEKAQKKGKENKRSLKERRSRSTQRFKLVIKCNFDRILNFSYF